MHELSIAQSIVEIVEQHVSAEDREAVRAVKVRIGEMAGVVPDSLEFCFSAITAASPLQHSTLIIEQIPFLIHCNACGNVFTNTIGFVVCPHCEAVDTTVIGGTELHVTEIELSDPVGIV